MGERSADSAMPNSVSQGTESGPCGHRYTHTCTHTHVHSQSQPEIFPSTAGAWAKSHHKFRQQVTFGALWARTEGDRASLSQGSDTVGQRTVLTFFSTVPSSSQSNKTILSPLSPEGGSKTYTGSYETQQSQTLRSYAISFLFLPSVLTHSLQIRWQHACTPTVCTYCVHM